MLFLYLSPVIVYPAGCAAVLYARGRFNLGIPDIFVWLWPIAPFLGLVLLCILAPDLFGKMEKIGNKHRLRAIDRRRTL